MLETGTEIGTDVRVGEGIVGESVTNYVFNSVVNLEIPEQKLLWQRALITPYSSFFSYCSQYLRCEPPRTPEDIANTTSAADFCSIAGAKTIMYQSPEIIVAAVRMDSHDLHIQKEGGGRRSFWWMLRRSMNGLFLRFQSPSCCSLLSWLPLSKKSKSFMQCAVIW